MFIGLITFAPTVITPTIIIRIILAAIMLLGALAAVVLVLLQRSTSDGTSALSGSRASSDDAESFYGKNKGMRTEAKLKLYTWISFALVTVCSIVFFILSR